MEFNFSLFARQMFIPSYSLFIDVELCRIHQLRMLSDLKLETGYRDQKFYSPETSAQVRSFEIP